MMIKRVSREIGNQGHVVPKSNFVYVRPSFVMGIARLFDFGGTLNTYYQLTDEDPNEADARAIASDWEAVGKDIADAMDWHVQFVQESDSPESDLKRSSDAE